jgi:tetratricopeptide (TPR) repeat protein
MLETLRAFAAEKLAEMADREVIRARHAHFFLALALQAVERLHGEEQAHWLERLEGERDNLRGALEWFQGAGSEGHADVRLALALRRFWELRGPLAEGRQWLEWAVACSPEGSEARAQAFTAAGSLAREQHDFARAQSCFTESLAIARARGDPRGIAVALNDLGLLAQREGDDEAARPWHEESLAIVRTIGDRQVLANALFNLGALARRQGDTAAARSYWEECHAVDRELGVRLGFASWELALLAWEADQRTEAKALWAAILVEARDSGSVPGIARALACLASVAVSEGSADTAARLWGAALSLRERLAPTLPSELQAPYDRDAAVLSAALGAEGIAAATAQGRDLSLEEAYDLGLGVAGVAASPPERKAWVAGVAHLEAAAVQPMQRALFDPSGETRC